jgi:hypothetical protein
MTDPVNGCVHNAAPAMMPMAGYARDGFTLTAHGPLKILVVMVEFPDDTWEPNHPQWPLGAGQLPVWANPAVQGGGSLLVPYNQFPAFNPAPNSLSEFFFDMSKHSPSVQAGLQPLRIYGDVIHHRYARSRANVAENAIRPEAAVAEVLDAITIPQAPVGTRGFQRYDTWTFNGPYSHANVADNGVRWVDMVIVCWRNINRDLLAEEWPLRGTRPPTTPPGAQSLTDMDWLRPTRAAVRWDGPVEMHQVDLVNGEPIMVDFNYRTTPQSGRSIWFRNFLDEPGLLQPRFTGIADRWFRGLVHEVAHHLVLGAHWNESSWTLIANTGDRGYNPSAMEMAQLGWAAPKHTLRKNQPTSNLATTLGDLYLTGEFIQVEIDAPSGQWYYLENHTLQSKWDNVVSDARTTAADRMARRGLYLRYGDWDQREQGLKASTPSTTWPVVRHEFVWGKWRPIFAPPEDRLPDALLGWTSSEQVWLSDQDRILNVPIESERTPQRNSIYLIDDNGTTVDRGLYEGGGDPEMFTEDCGRRLLTTSTNPGSHFTVRSVVNGMVQSTPIASDASMLITGRSPSGVLSLRLDQGATALPNVDRAIETVTIDAATIATGGNVTFDLRYLTPPSGPSCRTYTIAWPTIANVTSYRITLGDDVLVASAATSPVTVSVCAPSGIPLGQPDDKMFRITALHGGGTIEGCRPLELHATILSGQFVNAKSGHGSPTSHDIDAKTTMECAVHGNDVVVRVYQKNLHIKAIGVTDIQGKSLPIGRWSSRSVDNGTVVTIPLGARHHGMVGITIETNDGPLRGTILVEAP